MFWSILFDSSQITYVQINAIWFCVTGKPCPNRKCTGRLEIMPCRGHCGYPVTHFWRHTDYGIFFQVRPIGYTYSKYIILGTFGLNEYYYYLCGWCVLLKIYFLEFDIPVHLLGTSKFLTENDGALDIAPVLQLQKGSQGLHLWIVSPFKLDTRM